MNFSSTPPLTAQLRLLIALTLLLALLGEMFPIPAWMHWLWPSWIGLALLYWGVRRPGAVGILGAWGVGLILDMLLDAPWGLHALSLALIMRLQIALHKRLSFTDDALQQAPLIFILLLLLQACAGVINPLFGLPAEFFFGLPALSGTLLWVLLQALTPRRFSSVI